MHARALYLSPLVPPETRLFNGLLWLAAALFITVSTFLLDLFGWHYGAPGGSVIEKMHPATWVLVLTLFLSASARGNPLSALISAAHAHPAILIYLAAVAVLIVQAIVILKSPFTTYIDTFLTPAIVFLLLHQMTEKRGRSLSVLLHNLFFINALIGIAEFVFGFRVTPFVIEGIEYGQEWRSSALLGHPLSNALMTGCYVLALALGAGRELPYFYRLAIFIVTALSMVVFGGRAATLILVILLTLLLLRKFLGVLAGRPFDLRTVWFILATIPFAIAAFAVFYDMGFFDEFIGRITDDEGSASTRLAMFDLFHHLTWYDLAFGPDPTVLQTYINIYGLNLGIESFWVAMVLYNGFVVAIPFFVVLGVFCWQIARYAQTGPALWMLVSFFAVASASVSLSAKTPDFALLTLMILVLFRRPLGRSRYILPGAPGHTNRVGDLQRAIG